MGCAAVKRELGDFLSVCAQSAQVSSRGDFHCGGTTSRPVSGTSDQGFENATVSDVPVVSWEVPRDMSDYFAMGDAASSAKDLAAAVALEEVASTFSIGLSSQSSCLNC